MKKLLVVLLALTFVVAMAAVTFAVTTTQVDGKVEVTLTSADQFGGSVDGKAVIDLAKDYGNGYSAGLKIKLSPTNNADVITIKALKPADAATDANVIGGPLADPAPADVDSDGVVENYYYYKVSVDNNDAVAYDGDGWIKMVKDYGTITLQSGGINGNCAKDLGGKDDLAGGPGVKFESTTLVDGLALTVVLNDVNNNYNYLLKGDYTADALNIGAGYQSENPEPGATSAMAAWVGYTVNDAMKVGFEYTSRTLGAGPAATAMQLKFGYAAGALTANALYLSKDAGWYTDDADAGAMSFLKDFKATAAQFGSIVEADAKYALSDTFSVNGTIEYAMVDSLGSNNMMLKVGCEDKLSDAVVAGASFTSKGQDTKLALTLTDTLAAGLVASLELDSTNTAGVDAQTYTAKVTATL